MASLFFALSPFRPFALSPNYIEELVAHLGALTAEVPRRPIASRAVPRSRSRV